MFKKVSLLVVALGVLFANSAFAYNVQLKPFKDEQNDYARESIYTLSALGIINGYEDGTYRANADLSREAFVKLLVMARQLDTSAAVGKTPVDVAKTRWSAPVISAAYAHQWIDSLLDKQGMFRPAQTITRQEVAMLVGKALLESETEQTRQQWLGGDWKTERDARAFKDQSSINAAMQPYVYYAANRGMMEGDPSGFKPNAPLIRKQAAAVIYRLIDDRVSGQKVDFTGYYAIQSYPAIQQMNKLAHVIFGWSHLSYSTAGTAGLDVSTTVNKIPAGYEEAIAAADVAQASKELMVFYDGSNLKDFLKDEPAQQAFVQSLLATLNNSAYGFTGVSMDFEGLKEAGSAPDYVRFLQKVKDQLGTALTLSVAVPPIQYYKGYDLAAIGKLADTVILMAYDFTHSDSKLPSAPLPLVNDTVATALQSIPKEKLVLGISKQANQWITSGGGVTGNVLSPAIADVEKRLAMPGVTRTWEMPYFLAKATFKDERGSHELYYEDTQSIAKKIWVAKFYELKGVSLWFMGNYTASDWTLVGEQMAK
ncbi:S-layer domain protein [Paenibacillus curdlanolyticus YK9]|uniref:S-layer domain protein n=1 Tax=Paenibacillus curdlanolyticus YK9 TaxID=717606 RepID=E0IA81_9BACL|nr:S-layer homology domain-containing protein [Paenibacillus curdlanolyticus]EFM10658.1 S-layer domain protein [Paenibacillus curdlanolyticus YK9]